MSEYENFSDFVKSAPLPPEIFAAAQELGRKASEELDALTNPQNYEFAFDTENDFIFFRKRPGFGASVVPNWHETSINLGDHTNKGS